MQQLDIFSLPIIQQAPVRVMQRRQLPRNPQAATWCFWCGACAIAGTWLAWECCLSEVTASLARHYHGKARFYLAMITESVWLTLFILLATEALDIMLLRLMWFAMRSRTLDPQVKSDVIARLFQMRQQAMANLEAVEALL